jgi:astacin
MKTLHFIPQVRTSLTALVLLTGWCVTAAEPDGWRSEVTPAEAVPPGYKVVEGDILVRLPAPGEIEPAATFKTTQFWPNGIVYYEFDANVSAANRTIAVNAMAVWEAVANVDWRARNGEANYVHIQNSTVNNSAVGMSGGEQIINYVSWGTPYRMVHEMGHAMGLYHEQSRSDRDTYVTINWANIETDMEGNFEIAASSDHYGPYDFDSVMHYDQCSFTTCASCSAACRTITVKPAYAAEWQDAIGQRDHLSKYDAMTMSFLYPETNWRFLDRTYTGLIEVGTFLLPAKNFTNGKAFTPTGGTLWIQPGTYTALGTHTKAMTLRAPLGSVLLN